MIINGFYRSMALKLVKIDQTIKQNKLCTSLVSSVQECRSTKVSKHKKIPHFSQHERQNNFLKTESLIKKMRTLTNFFEVNKKNYSSNLIF